MDAKFDQNVLPWIGRIERQFSILMKEALAPLDLTYPEFRMVGILWGEEEGHSQKYLAARLGLDASAVSVTLKSLEKNKIVERVRDQNDARIVRVKCAPKAYEMTQVLSAYSEQEMSATSGFSDTEKQQLLQLLARVSQNLSQKTGLL